MTIFVLSASLEVAYVIATEIFTPPDFFIGVEDLFGLFGTGFLIIALTVPFSVFF